MKARSLTFASVDNPTLIHSFIRTFIHPFIRSFIHSFIRSYSNTKIVNHFNRLGHGHKIITCTSLSHLKIIIKKIPSSSFCHSRGHFSDVFSTIGAPKGTCPITPLWVHQCLPAPPVVSKRIYLQNLNTYSTKPTQYAYIAIFADLFFFLQIVHPVSKNKNYDSLNLSQWVRCFSFVIPTASVLMRHLYNIKPDLVDFSDRSRIRYY